jgi:hypothetical protein
MVLIPKRVLVEVYALLLEQDDAIQKLAESRVDIHATRRKLEELLNQYVPGLVLEIMLRQRDNEPTPFETPDAKDIENSKPKPKP